MMVFLKYIENNQFLKNPDFDLFNVILELAKRLGYYQLIINLVYYFLIDSDEYFLTIEQIRRDMRDKKGFIFDNLNHDLLIEKNF